MRVAFGDYSWMYSTFYRHSVYFPTWSNTPALTCKRVRMGLKKQGVTSFISSEDSFLQVQWTYFGQMYNKIHTISCIMQNNRQWSREIMHLASVCLSVFPGLWELHCAPPHGYRTTLGTNIHHYQYQSIVFVTSWVVVSIGCTLTVDLFLLFLCI